MIILKCDICGTETEPVFTTGKYYLPKGWICRKKGKEKRLCCPDHKEVHGTTQQVVIPERYELYVRLLGAKIERLKNPAWQKREGERIAQDLINQWPSGVVRHIRRKFKEWEAMINGVS